MDLPADDDVVYVPARPVAEGDERVPAVELRRLAETGEPVALAFSTVAALVRSLGPEQPWLGLPMYAFVVWLRTQDVCRIQIDPVHETGDA